MSEGEGAAFDSSLKQERALVKSSWNEIREYHLKSKFSEICEAGFVRIAEWEKSPRLPINEAAWNKDVAMQIEKADSLRKGISFSGTHWLETNKLFAIGDNMPEIGKAKLTRLYVGLDPRKATDAFIALARELEANGVAKDIETALNLEAVKAGKLAMNMLVLYDPASRPEVLDKMMQAYRNAKLQSPDAFSLTDRQKASVTRINLTQFKAIIDANLAFVEMDAEDQGRGWDAMAIMELKQSINLPPHQLADQDFVTLMRRKSNVTVLTNLDHHRTLQHLVKPGETLIYKRKMTAPALIQRGTSIAA
ncbi:hypothetical protein BH11PAT1_BH11PAT1_0510 [soil metagenome]